MRKLPPLSRRTFLGGAAAAVALPFLDIMRSARAGSPVGPPARMLFYFVPNGIPMPAWTPSSSGPDWEMSPLLAPLEDLREELLLVSGLANRPAEDDVAGDHARGTASFLTEQHISHSEGENIQNGISVDQVAAPLLGSGALFPSLQLGIDGGDSVGACDSGYSCAYVRSISWAGPSTPLAKMVSPRLLFDRMFAGFDPSLTAQERARRQVLRSSVLDLTLDDTDRLSPRLGVRDRQKLDEYLTGLRELELRIAAADEELACSPPDRPAEELTFQRHVETMTDLMVLAFRCDLTRCISFMLGNGSSYRSFAFLGAAGAHHELSHHQDDPEKIAALETIAAWELEQFGSLLRKLQAHEEEDGTTLLDQSMVYLSSEISDGNGHWHYDLPVLLAGRLGGLLDTGQHLLLPDERPRADLYLALLQAIGSGDSSFGANSSGPLLEVLT